MKRFDCLRENKVFICGIVIHLKVVCAINKEIYIYIYINIKYKTILLDSDFSEIRTDKVCMYAVTDIKI